MQTPGSTRYVCPGHSATDQTRCQQERVILTLKELEIAKPRFRYDTETPGNPSEDMTQKMTRSAPAPTLTFKQNLVKVPAECSGLSWSRPLGRCSRSRTSIRRCQASERCGGTAEGGPGQPTEMSAVKHACVGQYAGANRTPLVEGRMITTQTTLINNLFPCNRCF